jgi:hypothetical protein
MGVVDLNEVSHDGFSRSADKPLSKAETVAFGYPRKRLF